MIFHRFRCQTQSGRNSDLIYKHVAFRPHLLLKPHKHYKHFWPDPSPYCDYIILEHSQNKTKVDSDFSIANNPKLVSFIYSLNVFEPWPDLVCKDIGQGRSISNVWYHCCWRFVSNDYFYLVDNKNG